MLTDKTDKEIMDFVLEKIKETPKRTLKIDDGNNGDLIVNGFYIDIDSSDVAKYLYERLPDAFINEYRGNGNVLGPKISQALEESGHLDDIKKYAKVVKNVDINQTSIIRLESNPGPFEDVLTLTFSVPYE
ncbi:hypothetical protein [Bacillus altitudinis]|uniref:hypothetical protein n=1 Tax=Bacillus altitudinis TaxID=293387 RepID=UPI00398296CA